MLGLKAVDAGHGWLIFALPPAEAAIHPADSNEKHELYFMTDHLDAEIAALAAKRVTCTDVQEARWGRVVKIPLPGGGQIGLYQPRHATALELTKG